MKQPEYTEGPKATVYDLRKGVQLPPLGRESEFLAGTLAGFDGANRPHPRHWEALAGLVRVSGEGERPPGNA